jgi:hypothetical protein
MTNSDEVFVTVCQKSFRTGAGTGAENFWNTVTIFLNTYTGTAVRVPYSTYSAQSGSSNRPDSAGYKLGFTRYTQILL